MREYYIRREGDEDSSGPFDLDQISSMIEAGQLDASAYFYDIESENWQLISSNQEMMDVLFPKKRKLLLRTEEVERKRREEEAARAAEQERLEAEAQAAAEAEGDPEAQVKEPTPKVKKAEAEEPREKLEVAKMLAMAEGRADDPSGKSPREKKAAVAYLGLRLLTAFFLVSILAMGLLERELVLSANALAMAKSPYLLIGAFDLVLLVLLLLQVTEVYPVLRFRAALGLGLLSMLFYASGDGILLASNLLLMVGVYACSGALKKSWIAAGAACGILGAIGYALALALN